MVNFIPFLSYVFVTSFTPGPNNIMSMINAKEFGFKKTLRFNLGVTVGFLIIMLLSGYFNLMLINLAPKILRVMGIIGAAYMVYLAVKILGSKPQAKKDRVPNTFVAGLTLQFINPKVIFYGLTVISTFVIPYDKSNVSLFLFSIFLAVVGFVSTSCWAYFGAMLQNFLSKYHRLFNLCMSLLLFYCAISIFLH